MLRVLGTKGWRCGRTDRRHFESKVPSTGIPRNVAMCLSQTLVLRELRHPLRYAEFLVVLEEIESSRLAALVPKTSVATITPQVR